MCQLSLDDFPASLFFSASLHRPTRIELTSPSRVVLSHLCADDPHDPSSSNHGLLEPTSCYPRGLHKLDGTVSNLCFTAFHIVPQHAPSRPSIPDVVCITPGPWPNFLNTGALARAHDASATSRQSFQNGKNPGCCQILNNLLMSALSHKRPPSRDVQVTKLLTITFSHPHKVTMLQVALLAALTNVATAVVSAAHDPVVFNTSSPPLFGSRTNCSTSGPRSCGGGDPSQEGLCCYEHPSVSCIRYLPVSWHKRPN